MSAVDAVSETVPGMNFDDDRTVREGSGESQAHKGTEETKQEAFQVWHYREIRE